MIAGSLTKLGVVLVVAGALLMAGPVFGFDTLSTDRGVNVGTTQDQNALLGIEDNSGTSGADVTPPDGEGEVFFLTDTEDTFSDISAEVLTFDGDPTQLTASVEPTSDGSDFAVRVSCGNSDLNTDGTLTLGFLASSPSVSVELERTTEETVQVQCNGGGPPGGGQPGFASVSAGDVTSSNTQELTFTLDGKLSNGETVTIDITGLLADYGGASIDTATVGGGSIDPEDRTLDGALASATITVTAQGNIKAGEEVQIVLDGVSPIFDAFASATFSTSSTEASDSFAIDSGGGTASTASAGDDTGSVDETLSRAELESIPLDELERFDSYDDLERYIEAETDVEVVDRGG